MFEFGDILVFTPSNNRAEQIGRISIGCRLSVATLPRVARLPQSLCQ
jgi:hypothetical protein